MTRRSLDFTKIGAGRGKAIRKGVSMIDKEIRELLKTPKSTKKLLGKVEAERKAFEAEYKKKFGKLPSNR